MNRRKFILSLLGMSSFPYLIYGSPSDRPASVIPTNPLLDGMIKEDEMIVPLEINDELLIQAAEHAPETSNISLNQLMVTNEKEEWVHRWSNPVYSNKPKGIPVASAEGLILFNLNLGRYAGQFFTFQLKEEDTGLTILKPSQPELINNNGHPLNRLETNQGVACLGWFSPGERLKKFPWKMTRKDIAGKSVRYTFKTYTGLYDTGFFPKKPYDILEFKVRYPEV